MGKISKIDFVIHEDDFEEVIFRFLPRQSNCHSFGDILPTKWEEVYKVYYAYKIFIKWKEDGHITEVFNCGCDECSIIDEVSERIKHIVEGKKSLSVNRNGEEYVIELLNKEVVPFGYGVSWTINEIINNMRNEIFYEIVLWKHDRIGYRFYLDTNKLEEFGKYLNECCEYMLAHGDPI